MMSRMIYEKALNKWGKQFQIDVCIEELSELIHALMKIRRTCKNMNDFHRKIDNVREEIADVTICIEQMNLIFDDLKIDKIKIIKLKKLKELTEK